MHVTFLSNGTKYRIINVLSWMRLELFVLILPTLHGNRSRVFCSNEQNRKANRMSTKVKRNKWLIAGRNPFNSSNCVNMTKLCELIRGSTQFRLLSTVHSINVDNYTALPSIALISLSSDSSEDKAQLGHSSGHKKAVPCLGDITVFWGMTIYWVILVFLPPKFHTN